MGQFSDPQLTTLPLTRPQRISLACLGHIFVFLVAFQAADVSYASPEALHPPT